MRDMLGVLCDALATRLELEINKVGAVLVLPSYSSLLTLPASCSLELPDWPLRPGLPLHQPLPYKLSVAMTLRHPNHHLNRSTLIRS